MLTAVDTYRPPLTAAEAEDELRRVAGTQLDGRLVWLFVTQVLPGRLLEHEHLIADLEAELQVQRRVRGALDTPARARPARGLAGVSRSGAGRSPRSPGATSAMPKANRMPRCARSTQPSKPNAAWRTSSTQW